MNIFYWGKQMAEVSTLKVVWTDFFSVQCFKWRYVQYMHCQSQC